MRKAYILLALLLAGALPPAAADTALSRDQVSDFSLPLLLDKSAYDDSGMDEDGDLYVKRGGITIYVFPDTERALLKFSTGWRSSGSISENRAVRLVNKWNYDTVLARAIYAADDGAFLLQYHLTFEGGLNGVNYTDTLDWLFRIAQAFEEYLDNEDAI